MTELLLIWGAAAARILPHPSNFAPIGAMALFGGAHLAGRKAWITPLLAMFISDVFLGFHSTMPWVYGSFFLITLLGRRVQKRVNPVNLMGASLVASILFYLVTNFGVWFSTSMYPKTLAGLTQSYFMALPFFRNTILGDLFYSSVLFGSYALVKNSEKVLLLIRLRTKQVLPRSLG